MTEESDLAKGMAWIERGKEYVKVKWTQLTFDWSDLEDDDE